MRRKVILADGEFYHVFNKTINSEVVFDGVRELKRALAIINFYRFQQDISYSRFIELNVKNQVAQWDRMSRLTPLVLFHAFDLMPNHFHFLVQQVHSDGIRHFVSDFQNSFAKYFNKKNEREGSLFKSKFKAVRVETEEEFLHLSRYIHINHLTSYLMRREILEKYPYTSLSTYMGNYHHDFITTDRVDAYFKTKEAYAKFLYDQVDYQRKLKELKHLIG